jgi:hypothetical protein
MFVILCLGNVERVLEEDECALRERLNRFLEIDRNIRVPGRRKHSLRSRRKFSLGEARNLIWVEWDELEEDQSDGGSYCSEERSMSTIILASQLAEDCALTRHSTRTQNAETFYVCMFGRVE